MSASDNKIAVVGGRDFNDYEWMCEWLSNLTPTEIVSGGARGADSLAERYAKEHNIPLKVFPADWDRHGKAAGFLRNRQIADYADFCVAFWDRKSKGTAHTIGLFRESGKRLMIVGYRDAEVQQ